MSRTVVLVIALLLGLGAAAPTQTLDVGSYRLSIQNDTLIARDHLSKRVLWRRPAPARAYGWLGGFDGVAVGVGMENKRYEIGSQDSGKLKFVTEPFKTVFALNARTGAEVWRSKTLRTQDEGVIGRVAIFSEPNTVYTFSVYHVVDIVTGKTVFGGQGSFEKFGDRLILSCLDAPTPYCDSNLAVAWLNLITLESRGYIFEKPSLEDCDYIGDGDLEAKRFTLTHADFVLRVSCGYVFLRYRWDLPGSQIPVVRMLKEPRMPV